MSRTAVSDPAPGRCVAYAGPTTPWRWAVPQETDLQTEYLLLRCDRCGTASTAGPPPAERAEIYETGTYQATAVRGQRLVEAVRTLYERQKLTFLSGAGIGALAPLAAVLEVIAGLAGRGGHDGDRRPPSTTAAAR